jgi:hypothetical protein
LLFVVCCLLFVVCCLLFVVCCLLFVGCWLLVVGCWLLVVGCWLKWVGASIIQRAVMKTTILLSPALALAVFCGAFHPAAGRSAERDGYSIEIKVTPKEGEARVTTATGVALEVDRSVTLPLTLAHSENPATIDLSFELAPGSVSIDIEDFDLAPGGDGTSVRRRDFFQAFLFFEFSKEKTICTTAAETFSMLITAPTVEKAEKEGGAGASGKNSVTIDVKQLEVSFQKMSDRKTIYGSIYNPTERQISQLVVRVRAPASGDFEGLDRRYVDRVSVGALSDSSLQIDTQLPALPEGVEFEITLESAR